MVVPPGGQEAIEYLQPMLEASRYPSGNANEPIPADLISEEDARTGVAFAEEVIAWVQTLLQHAPGRTRRKTTC